MLTIVHHKGELTLRTPAHRLQERQAIARQVQAFLKKGGKIQQIPMNVSRGDLNRPLNLKPTSA